MIRRIGIDFGTSTTVLRVKNYADDGRTPIGSNVLSCDSVKFGGMDTVESVVREWTEGGARQLVCGAKAINDRPGSTLWSGFKMDLESPDAERAERAWELTDAFFRYLYSVYSEDNANGSFGDAAEREETWVSHPVKWREETARRLAESAEKAGFKSVRRMNEAQAAVTSVALRNVGQLREKLALAPGDSCRVLLVDMGAGTTDLVLGDYSYAGDADQMEFRADVCWPLASGEAARDAGRTCGGREFDQRLMEYFQELLRQSGLQAAAFLRGDAQVKNWKERNLSPSLAENVAVDSFAPFDMYQQMTGNAIPFRLDREAALQVFRGQMSDLIELVNGCMARTDAPCVDAIVPVGGGSRWFFVQDLLSGELDVDGKSLSLARKDGTRPVILPVYRPQETVAQGLVLAPLSAAGMIGGGQKESNPQIHGGDAPSEEPAAEIGELWRREEYADCLARRFVNLMNEQRIFANRGKSFAKVVGLLRPFTGEMMELLSQREEISILVYHHNIYVSGTITRADCNEWAAKEEYAPPFPGHANAPDHAPVFSYTIKRGENNSGIEAVRTYERDYLLTEEHRERLRASLQKLRKRTEGMRSHDEIVESGLPCISPKTFVYWRSTHHIDNLKQKDIQVYYCHPQTFFTDAVVVTDLGIFTCSSAANDTDISLYSWYELAIDGGVDILPALEKTECGKQLCDAILGFLTWLKSDFHVDIGVKLT